MGEFPGPWPLVTALSPYPSAYMWLGTLLSVNCLWKVSDSGSATVALHINTTVTVILKFPKLGGFILRTKVGPK